MQRERDSINYKKGAIDESVLKAISGVFIILAFMAVISLFASASGSSGGGSSNSKPGNNDSIGNLDGHIIFVVNDMMFEVPEETTWEEFVSGETYLTPDFSIKNNNVYYNDSLLINSATNEPVSADSKISSAIEYKDSSYSEESIPVINFTINGETYYAEKDMTWNEWCSSSYNTKGYSCSGSYVYLGSPEQGTLNVGGTFVSPLEIIVGNKSYSLDRQVGGGN